MSKRKVMNAYVYSCEDGTVQIGQKMFQPPTGAIYRCDDKPWLRSGNSLRENGIMVVSVKGATMKDAEIALMKAFREYPL